MGILPLFFGLVMFLLRCLEHENFDKWKLSRLTAEGCDITETLLGLRERASTCDNLLLGSAANLVILNLIMILKMLSPSASSFVAD